MAEEVPSLENFAVTLEKLKLPKTASIFREELEKKNSINNNFNDFKLKKYLIDNFNKKNRSNHNFYESKSFSLQNKLINQNIKNIHYNNILNGNITPNSNRIFFHQYSFKTFGVNKGKNNEYIKNSNSNNNIYTVNTSFNTNIYKYNNN